MKLTITLPKEAPRTEHSDAFLLGMVKRMLMSFYKYGCVADAYPSRVDAIKSLKDRLTKFEDTGNTEYLMDVANFAMIEYMHPRHPLAHFKAEDSAASPGRVWNNGTTHAGSNDNRETRNHYSRSGD